MSDEDFLRENCTPEGDRRMMLAIRHAVAESCRVPGEYIRPDESLDFLSPESEMWDPSAFLTEVEKSLGITLSDELALNIPTPWPVRRWWKIVQPAPVDFAAWAHSIIRFLREHQAMGKTDKGVSME
jgi:hypothetical protein